MAKRKQPVTVWGIEFDALIDEQKTMSASIPSYPVENGFPVSDTIINDPISIQMTLYLTNTPVTWLFRHGSSTNRVNRICEEIENKWLSKELTKVVTTDTIYTNMGITQLTIKKSSEIGYAREISVTMQKVEVTEKKTVDVPSYILKSGETQENAGKAATSKTSSKSSGSSGGSSSSRSSGSSGSGSKSGGSGSSGSSSSSGSKSSSSGGSDAKNKQSILYGVANGLGFI